MDDSNTPPIISSIKGGDHITRRRRRVILISFAAVVLVIGILWTWKQIQLNQLRSESEREYERLEVEARYAVISSHKEHLKMLAKPFAWVVRTELIKNNIDQINEYANELIKEKNIQSIMIVNSNGKIVSSTNKKWEGRFYLTIGEESHLNADSTVIRNIKDSVLIMTSPIMGLNSRLGTLLLAYSLTGPAYVAATE